MIREDVNERLTDEKQEEFETLSNGLIKYLNDNFHPHTHCIITPTSAVITEGAMTNYTEEFLKD